MNTAIYDICEELNDFLLEDQHEAPAIQARLEQIVREYAPAPGDNGLTFEQAQARVCATLTQIDEWDTCPVRVGLGESLIDVVRNNLRASLIVRLNETVQDFQNARDDGNLIWCAMGHWAGDACGNTDEMLTCDECGADDCEQHGDTEERDDITNDAGAPVYPTLCESCYRAALKRQDERSS